MATQEAKTTRKRSTGKSATGTKRRSTKSAASQSKSPRTRKSTRNTSTRVRKQINVNKPLATSDTQDENRVAPPKYRKGSMRIVPLGGWVSRELKRKPMIVPVVADVAADMNKMESYND